MEWDLLDVILDIFLIFTFGESFAPNKATPKSNSSPQLREGLVLSDLPRKLLLTLDGITPESLNKLELELQSVLVLKYYAFNVARSDKYF